MTVKSLIFAAFALASVTAANAVPAKRVWRTVQQPDGTEIKVMLVGDERLHYFVTEDNVPLIEQNGAYYYANGRGYGMQATATLAHSSANRSQSELQAAQAAKAEISNPSAVKRNILFAPMKKAPSTGYTSDRRDITGKHKSIVILAEFTDKKFLSEHDSAFYNAEVNTPGYTNSYGAIGSIHDYFLDQSAGKLDLTFDVVGPVEMSYGYSHYGRNDSNGSDVGFWEFAAEALQKAYAQYPNLNWKDYDWDGDGEVENLYIIYAGYGEATSSNTSTIWPAQSSFDAYNQYYGSTYNLNFDGVKINTFACGNEESDGSINYPTTADTPAGIGTMTHEFSHCLGFPDLYDTSGSNYGMDFWSVMDYGPYAGPNNNGWVPVGYTAYEKWAAGWIDYSELQSNDTITGLRSTYNGGGAYAVVNDALPIVSGDKAEYFVLENRTKNRWDTYLPAQGLEVLHVNYVKSIWDNNAVNTTYNSNRKQNVTIVAADNSYLGVNSSYMRDNNNDLYPFNTLDSITPNSTPKLTFYTAQRNGQTTYQKPIYNIMWNRADSTVSFIFDPDKSLVTPEPVIGGEQYFADSTVVTITADSDSVKWSTDSLTWADYTEPFTLRDSTTVYAYAWRTGAHNSNVVSKQFIKQVKLPAPVISGDTAFTTAFTAVTITAEQGQARYATASRGKTSWRTYSGPFAVNKTDTVYAFATSTDRGYLNSDTVSLVFTKVEPKDTDTTTTAIKAIPAESVRRPVEIYTISGNRVTQSFDSLPKGIYIFRDDKGNTWKATKER